MISIKRISKRVPSSVNLSSIKLSVIPHPSLMSVLLGYSGGLCVEKTCLKRNNLQTAKGCGNEAAGVAISPLPVNGSCSGPQCCLAVGKIMKSKLQFGRHCFFEFVVLITRTRINTSANMMLLQAL